MTMTTKTITLTTFGMIVALLIGSISFALNEGVFANETNARIDSDKRVKIETHLERVQNDIADQEQKIASFTASTDEATKEQTKLDLKRMKLIERLTQMELDGKKNSPEARAVFAEFANSFDDSEIIRNPSVKVSDPGIELQGSNLLQKASAYSYNLWNTYPTGDTRYSCADDENITGSGSGSVTGYSTYSYLVGENSYPDTIDSGTSPNCHSTMYWDDEYAFIVFYIYNLPWIACGLDTPETETPYGTTCGVLTEGDVIYVMPKALYENLPYTSQYTANPYYDTVYM